MICDYLSKSIKITGLLNVGVSQFCYTCNRLLVLYITIE